MKNMKVFFFAALVGAFLLFRCTSGADAPAADAAAVDSTAAAAPAPAPAAAIPDSLDVAKAGANVYTKLADSLGMRVFEIVFEVGESVPVHSHPDHVVYAVTGGTLEVSGIDGKKTIYDLKPGMAMVSGADTHSATNTGKTPIKAVVVEVNRPR